MATNYSCEKVLLGDREFYVLKTKADNIKLVNIATKNAKGEWEGQYINKTTYYGMNASFLLDHIYLLNIAYQDGKNVGKIDSEDGYKNIAGTALIAWNNTTKTLKYYSDVKDGVLSRKMRKIVCRLWQNEVSQQ